MNFKKTKLATAVSTAALVTALTAPSQAVVVGGEGGWEVSFSGEVNLFYNQWDFDIETAGGGPGALDGTAFAGDSSHLQEGLLPAFFTFKAKSPTVNGLTGTAQISFAPDSSNSKLTRNDKGGSAIDMREVMFNVDGSFGTISAGRSLGLYQRQAILKDMTLFGVGAGVTSDAGGTTLGRIGYGYVYPEFRTRFAYKTPSINGFQLEVGVFDPQESAPGITGASTFAAKASMFVTTMGTATVTTFNSVFTAKGAYETDTPQFQAEATYNTSFQGGTLGIWAGGIWQDQEFNGRFGHNDDVTHWGWNVGADIGFGGFNVVGHYYDGEALGNMFKWTSGTGPGAVGLGVPGLGGSPGFRCINVGAGTTPVAAACNEADNDGFYIQGTYTFGGKTKIGFSYGESNQDSELSVAPTNALGETLSFNEVEHSMWTVGIYHDVTSWLKVVAEYNDAEQECSTAAGARCALTDLEVDGFSVGGFLFY